MVVSASLETLEKKEDKKCCFYAGLSVAPSAWQHISNRQSVTVEIQEAASLFQQTTALDNYSKESMLGGHIFMDSHRND